VRAKSPKESKEVLAIANALDGESSKGLALLSVATKSVLPIERVKNLLAFHTDYFVNVGGKDIFTLNRFGPFKGNIEEIAADIEREADAAEKRTRSALSGAILGLFRKSG